MIPHYSKLMEDSDIHIQSYQLIREGRQKYYTLLEAEAGTVNCCILYTCVQNSTVQLTVVAYGKW